MYSSTRNKCKRTSWYFNAASYYSAGEAPSKDLRYFRRGIKSINELWCHPIGHLDLLAPFQLRFGGSDCARAKHLIECELTLVLELIPGMDGSTVGGGSK